MSEFGSHRPKDAQAERTRWELWAILAIAAAVIFGSIIWRAATHHPAQPESTAMRPPGPTPAADIPAGAAGVRPPHPAP